MMPALARYQDDFVKALLAQDLSNADTPEIASLSLQAGFKVYRNTVLKACVDALRANFPTVEQLVGSRWFDAAAALYVRGNPPDCVSMIEYGATFAEFLAHFEPARELPYLSGVARLDRCWIESHIAADAEPAAPALLARLAPEALGAAVLKPHPATRWAWFDAHPIYTIWHRNREQVQLADDLPWVAQGALLTRPWAAVQWREIGRGACAFLDACAQDLPLAAAAQKAFDADPDLDLAATLAILLDAGALSLASGSMLSPSLND